MNKTKKILVISCTFIICLVLSFVIGRLSIIQNYKLIDIPCASRLLNSRELIKNKDIEYIKVSSNMINDNIILNDSEIIGKYVGSNCAINKGSFFFENEIEEISSMNDSSYFEIKKNETIYELFVKNTEVNLAHINNNMYVDLYLTIEKPEIVSDLLVSGVKICGLYNNEYEDITMNNDKRNSLSIISLIVNNDMVSILNKAQLYGKISIIPPSNPYEERKMFINKKGEILNYIN